MSARTYILLLCLALNCAPAFGQWTEAVWPATSNRWARREQMLDLVNAMQERNQITGTGMDYSDATNRFRWWASRALLTNLAADIRSAADAFDWVPYQYKGTNTWDQHLEIGHTRIPYYTNLVKQVVGADLFTGETTSNTFTFWATRLPETFDQMRTAINAMVWSVHDVAPTNPPGFRVLRAFGDGRGRLSPAPDLHIVDTNVCGVTESVGDIIDGGTVFSTNATGTALWPYLQYSSFAQQGFEDDSGLFKEFAAQSALIESAPVAPGLERTAVLFVAGAWVDGFFNEYGASISDPSIINQPDFRKILYDGAPLLSDISYWDRAGALTQLVWSVVASNVPIYVIEGEFGQGGAPTEDIAGWEISGMAAAITTTTNATVASGLFAELHENCIEPETVYDNNSGTMMFNRWRRRTDITGAMLLNQWDTTNTLRFVTDLPGTFKPTSPSKGI